MRKMLTAMVLLIVGFFLGWFLFVPVLAKIPDLLKYKERPDELVYNGKWAASFKIGGPQASPMLRAMIANFGLGANTADEAVYWVSYLDADGQRLSGGRTYEIRFAKEPAIQEAGFWSLCVYNSKDQFVPNPIKRYKLGGLSNLVKNSDGSFVLHLSPAPTGPQENWLPSPPTEEPIVLTIRMYAPRPEVLREPEKSPMPRVILTR